MTSSLLSPRLQKGAIVAINLHIPLVSVVFFQCAKGLTK
jgi:hypothetical protein